jgi:serine phosphatase RsbU (regulator of sigma subunit)
VALPRSIETTFANLTAEAIRKSKETEQVNKDMMASLRYAEKIQQSILPEIPYNMFVIYMPKDIVSGDFYWFYESATTRYIVAADCTGHGVPGAFLSIIGHTILNKIVIRNSISKSSTILNQLNIEINHFLQEEIDDGMDISVVVYDRHSYTAEFAGANHSIYLVRNKEVTIHKGDNFSIGLSSLNEDKTFTNVSFDMKPNDMIYMTSDGYTDQFGGPKDKKFQPCNLKKLLIESCTLSVEEQSKKIKSAILDWRGDYAQTDDIMLIGIRIE